jgi:hypothetical protein
VLGDVRWNLLLDFLGFAWMTRVVNHGEVGVLLLRFYVSECE